MMKPLFSNRWFLCALILFNFFFWIGVFNVMSLLFSGGVVHGEYTGLYLKNIVSSVNSCFAILGGVGLVFRIKKLYIFLLFFGVIGLGQYLINFVTGWGENPIGINDLIWVFYLLFFYGGILWGYKLLNE